MRVCIIGLGMIGRALAEEFSRAHHVMVIDNQAHKADLVREYGCEFMNADITDPGSLKTKLAEWAPNCLILTAAISTIESAVADPARAFAVNVIGTLNVLKAAVELGIKNVLYVSTDKTAATAQTADESAAYATGTKCPYVLSKIAAEIAAINLFGDKLTLTVLRPANVIGRDSVASRIVPRTCRRLIDGMKPLVNRATQHVKREFLFDRDLAKAVRGLAELRAGSPLGVEIYNIGSGSVLSAVQMVQALLLIAGKRPDYYELTDLQGRGHELGDQQLDSRKLKVALPEWRSTPIDSALEWVYNYYRDESNGNWRAAA